MLYFQLGTNLPTAVDQLSECVTNAQDLAGGAAGQDAGQHRSSYLRWVENTERQLRNVFDDVGMVRHLRTTEYWAIQSAFYQPFRVIRIINSEVTEQARWLQALVDRLRALQSRLEVAPGRATVVDTNVLLHYEPPWQVDWTNVVKEREVRLVLPLRVIEELDEKKYTARHDLADRARRLLSQLWDRLSDSPGAPVPLRDKVTIEVPVEDGTRIRTADADQEILEGCEQLRNVGRPPILVTGDTGMSLRARALRLDVTKMSDEYLRKRPRRGPQTPGVEKGAAPKPKTGGDQ